jgi:hypothetical protein
MSSPTSTIRFGRSYYPSKQFASASAEIDPHEWTGTIEPDQMVVFGPGGIGGTWAESTNPYEDGDQYTPSGYTYRNVVVLNVSDPFADNFLFFGKSAHDVYDGPRRAIVTPRGPCYSQGEYDQFIVYNYSATNITLSVQWDHAGTPSSTNAGHPGHGHVSMDVSDFLIAGGIHVLYPAWKRARQITAVHLYTKSGVPVAGGALGLLVNNSLVGAPITISTLAAGYSTQSVGPIDLTIASTLQVVLDVPAQPAGTDLIVELEYDFA